MSGSEEESGYEEAQPFTVTINPNETGQVDAAENMTIIADTITVKEYDEGEKGKQVTVSVTYTDYEDDDETEKPTTEVLASMTLGETTSEEIQFICFMLQRPTFKVDGPATIEIVGTLLDTTADEEEEDTK